MQIVLHRSPRPGQHLPMRRSLVHDLSHFTPNHDTPARSLMCDMTFARVFRSAHTQAGIYSHLLHMSVHFSYTHTYTQINVALQPMGHAILVRTGPGRDGA